MYVGSDIPPSNDHTFNKVEFNKNNKKENFTKEIIGNKTDSWRKLMLSILINESTTDRGLAAI